MPLIIISGPPSSGKTTRALQLKQFLETSPKIPQGSGIEQVDEEWIYKFVENFKIVQEEEEDYKNVEIIPTKSTKTSSFKAKKKITLQPSKEERLESEEWKLEQAVRQIQSERQYSMMGMTFSPSLPNTPSHKPLPIDPKTLLPSKEKKTNWTVYIVNEESLGLSRKEAYTTSKSENLHRANLLSAVTRLLRDDNIVIADGINGIKGYRYQMYLIAKAIPTTTMCIRISSSSSKLWNDTRRDKYDDEQWIDLTRRFEEPISTTRWDSPLINLLSSDLFENIENDVVEGLFGRDRPKPNLSTSITKISSTTYLQRINSTLDSICEILRQQGIVIIPFSGREVESKGWKFHDLQRLKHHWLSLHKITYPDNVIEENTARDFVDWILDWKDSE